MGRKLVIVALFILYIVLGNIVFNYLFGEAWGLSNTNDMFFFSIKAFFIGCVVAFLLSIIPTAIWPQNIWIWMVAYPFKILFFGIMVSLSVLFTKNTDDFIPAAIWVGIGVCMAASSYAGSKMTKRKLLKNRIAKT
ncbi:MAG: hypothetical protein WAU91_02345 [Desulfatitalea sp.]